MKYLENKTRVVLNQPPSLRGLKGTIVGRTTEYHPIIGATYIIQPDVPSLIRSDEYPYDFFGVSECTFDVIPKEKYTDLQEMILDYLNQPGAIQTLEAIRNHCNRFIQIHTHEISREVWKMNEMGLLAVISGKITPLRK
jgi:hypothetical protein